MPPSRFFTPEFEGRATYFCTLLRADQIRPILPSTNTIIDLSRQVVLCSRAKLLVAHHPVEDFVIAFHPLNEEVIEHAAEEGGKIGFVVCLCRLNNLLIPLSGGANLIEEELICLSEVSAKAFVQLFNQSG